ncbi:hypothetical protein GCM10027449_16850 [Sinomonas notoginsengisoli]|uniref:hypothetical protein n=1 Tax=Sinomonas notoginsengisoli TaxID=1457311 RepID=UPI001F3DD8AA|nr:hypothetical protein [Sinomonas notoginsengisoli]
MTRFLITYHGMPYPTAEVITSSRGPLKAWCEKNLGRAMVDFGTPLFIAGQVSEGEPMPSVDINGYTIIEARSADEARTMLENHPYIARGATIQINECLEM